MIDYNQEDLQDALKECYTYNKMGGLDRDMIKEFASEYKVRYEVLLEHLGWEP
jgi:hypothetical protein